MAIIFAVVALLAAIVCFIRGDLWMGIALFGISSINLIGMYLIYLISIERCLNDLKKLYSDKILADKAVAAVITAKRKADDGKRIH